MAVVVEFINVIIPVHALEERYPGGVEGYELACPNKTFCRDDHLTRIGFMSPADAQNVVESITATSSLTLLDGRAFADIAVVDSVFGPTASCPWLEFGEVDGASVCWLSGTEPGELAAPTW